MKQAPVVCPINIAPHDPDLETLMPLLAQLEQNELPTTDSTFARGTLLADGRLDLCKQNLGVQGCDALVTRLEHNQRIHALLLGTNGIGDQGANAIARLIRAGHLSTVYLGCNLINSAGVNDLCEAIESTSKVQALWLKRNPIGPDGATRLAKMLEVNISLKTLDVVNTGMGETGFEAIMHSLIEHNRSLEYLYLSGNGLDEQEAPRLAELLRENANLKGLFLSVNHLADAGLQTILAGLERNTTLKFLSLASNNITDRGASQLFEIAAKHPTLIALDLGYSPSTKVLQAFGNQITDSSIPALQSLLETSHVLDLDLHRNQFSVVAKTQIVTALEHNHHLQRLRLDLNDPKLEAFLERNRNRMPVDVHVPYSQLIRSVYR
jgi:Leucine Rich repeat